MSKDNEQDNEQKNAELNNGWLMNYPGLKSISELSAGVARLAFDMDVVKQCNGTRSPGSPGFADEKLKKRLMRYCKEHRVDLYQMEKDKKEYRLNKKEIVTYNREE